MSIKSSIDNLHEEIGAIEFMAHTMPEELRMYALQGIRRDIESLWNHVDDILRSKARVPSASSAPDTQPKPQNPAAAGNADPIVYDNVDS